METLPQEANYRPCARAEKVGDFSVALQNSSGIRFTNFQGSVKDGPNPLNDLEQKRVSGVCRLLAAKVRQCPQTCISGKVCGPALTCVDVPSDKNAGTIEVSGVGDGLTVSPSNKGFYLSTESIEYPGFDAGATIGLTAAGGEIPAFSLTVKGVAPLTVTPPDEAVRKGAPLRLSWEPSSVMTGARLHIIVSLDNHGKTKQQIECDAPDTGSLDIPEVLVSALWDLGVSGFPSLTMRRRAVESKTVGPGCVEFNVFAEEVLELQLEGITSCSGPEDCPGKTCITPEKICQ